MSEQAAPWGRIAEDGTVFVRTAEGEREVGTWLAGTPEEGLAHYQRRYEDLAAEVTVLERRAGSDPAATASGARRIRDSLATANVVGDLDALAHRLDAILAATAAKREEQAAARAAAAAQALDLKRGLAEEAESLAQSSDWKRAGDRLRAIGDEWRAIKGADRRTDSGLWRRVTAARDAFGKRRSAHFAELDEKRKAAAVRKEALVKEAEELSGSKEWGETAARYKALMGEWKAAGPAPKGVDDALWARFRAAQDGFFSRRTEVYAERDAEFRGNQEKKEQLLAEAEALDPAGDLDVVQQRLREVQERWDAIGKVPRESMHRLEQRMGAVEQRVRDAAEARWRRPDVSASPLVIRLRESVATLEQKVERARAAGRDAEAQAAAETLAAQREWLAQAERSSG